MIVGSNRWNVDHSRPGCRSQRIAAYGWAIAKNSSKVQARKEAMKRAEFELDKEIAAIEKGGCPKGGCSGGTTCTQIGDWHQDRNGRTGFSDNYAKIGAGEGAFWTWEHKHWKTRKLRCRCN